MVGSGYFPLKTGKGGVRSWRGSAVPGWSSRGRGSEPGLSAPAATGKWSAVEGLRGVRAQGAEEGLRAETPLSVADPLPPETGH